MAVEFPESEDPITFPITLKAHARDGVAGSTNRYTFGFDKVFDPEASQASVFKEISELVQSALDGQRVCIFAYGQTGSGKTFTVSFFPMSHMRMKYDVYGDVFRCLPDAWRSRSSRHHPKGNAADIRLNPEAGEGRLDIHHAGRLKHTFFIQADPASLTL